MPFGHANNFRLTLQLRPEPDDLRARDVVQRGRRERGQYSGVRSEMSRLSFVRETCLNYTSAFAANDPFGVSGKREELRAWLFESWPRRKRPRRGKESGGGGNGSERRSVIPEPNPFDGHPAGVHYNVPDWVSDDPAEFATGNEHAVLRGTHLHAPTQLGALFVAEATEGGAERGDLEHRGGFFADKWRDEAI